MICCKNGGQVCGKCFNILPDEKKSTCVRQTGLEAITEILLFPCRYHQQGCFFTFPFNTGNKHEVTCPHRHTTLPLLPPPPQQETSPIEYRYESEQVSLKIKCETVKNQYENDDKLELNLEITGNNGYDFNLKKVRQMETNIMVDLEGVVAPNHYLTNIVENHYETISSTGAHIACNKCRKYVNGDATYHCLFGHNCCKNCKGLPCLICGREIAGEPRFYCRNRSKGCVQLFLNCEITKHESDCEYNDFYCPIDKCGYIGILNNLLKHFLNQHDKDTINNTSLDTTLNKKDQQWYFYCYNRLFHCKYYHFDNFIEFIVKYIGSNDDARSFKYEVFITDNNTCFIGEKCKNNYCSGWNEVLLDKAVSFIFDEEKRASKSMKFDVKISILRSPS